MTQSVTKLPVTKEERAGRQDMTFLQQEIDQLVDQLDRGWRPFFRSPIFDYMPLARFESYWSAPAVDILDKEKSYELAAEVPGMDSDNLEVKILGDRLVIKGHKKESWAKSEAGCRLSERRYGVFERTFRLPQGVDMEKIDASLNNGVLTVVVPKSATGQKPSRRIEEKAA